MNKQPIIHIDLEKCPLNNESINAVIQREVVKNKLKDKNPRLSILVTPESLTHPWEDVENESGPLMLQYPTFVHTKLTESVSKIEELPLKILFTTHTKAPPPENSIFERLIEKVGRKIIGITRVYGCSSRDLTKHLRTNYFHIWHHKNISNENSSPKILLLDKSLPVNQFIDVMADKLPRLLLWQTLGDIQSINGVPLLLTLSDAVRVENQQLLLADFYNSILCESPETAVHFAQRQYAKKHGTDSGWKSFIFRGNTTDSTLFSEPPKKPPEDPPEEIPPILLKIQLLQRDGKMDVRVLAGPRGGEPVEAVPYPYSLEQLPAILKALDVGRFVTEQCCQEHVTILEGMELLRDNQLHPEIVKIVGQKLYNALFSRKVGIELEFARQEGSVACQIQFDPDDIILAQFPWETVHDGGNPLTPIRNGLELTRSITFAEPPLQFETTLPLRMLFVAPRPKNKTDLGDMEVRAVQNALSSLKDESQIEVEILTPPTWSALEEKLSTTQYDIIHFDGHGAFVRECPNCRLAHYPINPKCVKCATDMTLATPKGYLYFEDEYQNCDQVSIDELKVIIANSATRLVVLSACGSGVVKGSSIFNGIAPGLIQIGIPAVVAMQGSPEVKTTAKFMEQMYKYIAMGTRLPKAVNEGRREIYWDKPPMWFMPIVYLRSSDNTFGQLFKFRR